MLNHEKRTHEKNTKRTRLSGACRWIANGKLRKRILRGMDQPLTARQIAQRTGTDVNGCSHALRDLESRDLVRCLNPSAKRSRVYGLTDLGTRCMRRLHSGTFGQGSDHPGVDWDLYGWTCFRQRAAVLAALEHPEQASHIKRTVRLRDPAARMSANNVRDVVRLFLLRGLVCRVFTRGHVHPRYALTDAGKQIRCLLCRVEGRR